MTARLRDGRDYVFTNLGGEAVQFLSAEAAQIARALESWKDWQVFTPGLTPVALVAEALSRFG